MVIKSIKKQRIESVLDSFELMRKNNNLTDGK